MTNPISEEPSLVARIRSVTARRVWRFSLWTILIGVGVMIVGEIADLDYASQLGIWTMLSGLALAVLSKILAYVEFVRELNRRSERPPNSALEQPRDE